MVKRQILLFTILVSFIPFAKGGKESNTMGARASGMANCSILLEDIWSTENNPAGLGKLDHWGAGIAYENHFLLSEFSYRSAVFALPTSSGGFGLSLGQFGYSLYQENKIGLSYGQTLSKNLSMGVQLNYFNTQIGEGIGSRSGVSGNFGLQAQINSQLKVGAAVINANRAKLANDQDERLPTLIKIGLAYRYSKKVIFFSEIEKDIDFKPVGRFGLEYMANDFIYLRGGYSSNPSLTSFGFGAKLKQFQIDITSLYHNNTGFSPQIALSYRPKK